MNSAVAFFLAFISILIASISQIFLKKSAIKMHSSIFGEYLNLNTCIGYGLLIISTIFTVLALTVLTIQDTAMIEATGYIVIMFLGRLIFKEKITKGKVIGNIMILCGILLFYS